MDWTRLSAQDLEEMPILAELQENDAIERLKAPQRSSRPRTRLHRFLTAARASRSGSYSAVITRTVGACIPPSRALPAPAQTAHHGFKVLRTRSESFPNAAKSGRKIAFLTVNGGFESRQPLSSIGPASISFPLAASQSGRNLAKRPAKSDMP